MSHVTNLLLSMSTSENEDDRIAEVNRYFAERDVPPLVSIDDPSLPWGWYGGTKMLEACLYVGAFNYLSLDEFITHLRSVSWEHPSHVQLIIKDQHDERFQIVPLLPDDDPVLDEL